MKKIISILFTMFIFSGVFAQSADVITSILNTKVVTYGQVCYLSAVRQQIIEESDSYEAAMHALVEQGVVSEKVKSSDAISLQEVSHIFTKIWPDFKGGLMYRITGGAARYSYKSLKDVGILTTRDDPLSTVSGFDLLNILSSCMMEFGSEEECMTMDID